MLNSHSRYSIIETKNQPWHSKCHFIYYFVPRKNVNKHQYEIHV